MGFPKNYKREFLLVLTNSLGEIEITVKGEIIKALVTGATLSVLNPTQLSCSLPQSKASVQMVGTSNQLSSVFKSEPVPFLLGTVMGNVHFY